MGKLSSHPTTTLLAAVWVLVMVSAEAGMGGGDHRLGWLHVATCGDGTPGCTDELGMEWGHRRVLATTQYISYGALQRNTVPCSRRGASYYNCKEGAEANPYSRQCSAISRCRS